jgi:hypothetical protein
MRASARLLGRGRTVIAALDRRFALIVAACLVLVPVTVLSPLAAVALVATTFGVALGVRLMARMPQVFLAALGIALVGYAILGRGFAYLGVRPLFVGEVVLAIGFLGLVLRGMHREVLRSPVVYALIGFMLVGASASIPYLGPYGLDVLRDGVLWGYGIFALFTASSLLRSGTVPRAMRAYARALPWFLAWAPVAFLLRGFVDVPLLPGTDVPVVATKPGDTAVHLAGVMVFLVLGLQRSVKPRVRAVNAVQEWGWWALWLVGGALVFSINRGGMLAVMVAAAIVIALRPLSRWAKLLLVALVLGIVFVASGIEITHSSRRPLSAESLMQNLRSIVPGSVDESGLEGTSQWRLSWWTDIVNYTVFGEYFWTGKGFGINLAADDGYLTSAAQNRSPHNGHITVLARSGVPGLLLWVLTLGSFAFGMLRAYFAARRRGDEGWARLNLWVLAYWTAFVVNGAFDVFLEGPQGGIWFWSLIGFGVAIMRMQARGAPAPFEGRDLTPGVDRRSTT